MKNAKSLQESQNYHILHVSSRVWLTYVEIKFNHSNTSEFRKFVKYGQKHHRLFLRKSNTKAKKTMGQMFCKVVVWRHFAEI